MHRLSLKQINSQEYHKKEGLLLQFILNEFILSMQSINNLLENAKYLIRTPRSKKSFHELLKYSEDLVGSLQEDMRLFSWSTEGGSLKKLVTYSIEFAKKKKANRRRNHPMQNHATKSLLHALDLHDVAIEVKNQSQAMNPRIARMLKRKSDKAFHELKLFADATKKMISDYIDDENVLFFILRHKNQFDEVYDKNILKPLIKKHFYNSPERFESFLKNSYKKRGFDQLIPWISQLMSDIKS